MKATIRTSTIESYRQYLEDDMFVGDDVDTMPLSAFLDYCNRPGGAKTSKGTFFHSMLERNRFESWPTGAVVNSKGYIINRPIDGSAFLKDWCAFWFSDEMVMDTSSVQPPALANEVAFSKDFTHRGVTLTVTGTVDAVEAACISDTKTTATFDYWSYAHSMQWQVYCWLTGIDSFRYDVYVVKDPLKSDPFSYRVESVNRFMMQASAITHARIEKLLAQWIDMLINHSEQFIDSDGIQKQWAIEYPLTA